MAQDLLNISQESFALQIHKIASKTLVQLLRQLYELKWQYGKNWPIEKITDIERKESKIIFELQIRKYKTKKDAQEFNLYIKSINKGKRVY